MERFFSSDRVFERDVSTFFFLIKSKSKNPLKPKPTEIRPTMPLELLVGKNGYARKITDLGRFFIKIRFCKKWQMCGIGLFQWQRILFISLEIVSFLTSNCEIILLKQFPVINNRAGCSQWCFYNGNKPWNDIHILSGQFVTSLLRGKKLEVLLTRQSYTILPHTHVEWIKTISHSFVTLRVASLFTRALERS